LTIQSGGTVTIAAAGVGDLYEFGTGGFTCEAGSNCFHGPTDTTAIIRGEFRNWDDAAAGVSATWEEAGAWITPQTIILCPGHNSGAVVWGDWAEDCAETGAWVRTGSTNEIGMFWEGERYDEDNADEVSNIDEIIAGVTAGDLIQFVRPGNSSTWMSYENADVFEVVEADCSGAAGTTLVCWLIFDVDSTKVGRKIDPVDYPLSRRGIQEVITEATAFLTGSRGPISIVTPVNFVTEDWEWGGTWLYLAGDSDGSTDTYKTVPLLIADTRTTNDTIRIARDAGLPIDLAASSTVFISHVGIKAGDPFVVINPTTFTSAAALTIPNLPTINLRAEAAVPLTIRGVLFSDLGQNELTATDALDVTLQNVAYWQFTNTSGQTNQLFQSTNNAGGNITMEYISLSGGGLGATTAEAHGFQVGAGTGTFTVAYSDGSTRYNDDDTLFNGGTNNMNLTASNIVCKYQADSATSGGCLESSSQGNIATLNGVVSRNGMDEATGNFGVLTCNPPSVCNLNDIAIIGDTSERPCYDVGSDPNSSLTQGCVTKNFTAIGNGGALHGWRGTVDGFYSRDSSNITSMYSLVGDCAAPATRIDLLHKNGIVQDFDANFDNQVVAGAATLNCDWTLENIAFINTDLTANLVGTNHSFFDLSWSALGTRAVSQFTMKNISLIWSDPTLAGDAAVYSVRDVIKDQRTEADVRAVITVEDILIAGARPNRCGLIIDPTATTNWNSLGCFMQFDVKNPATGINADCETGVGAPWPTYIRYQDPVWTNPGIDNFAPAEGGPAEVNGCGVLGGALAPGVKRKGFSHYVNGLEPQSWAPGVGGGGGEAGSRAW
jgi:hypothetical protein